VLDLWTDETNLAPSKLYKTKSFWGLKSDLAQQMENLHPLPSCLSLFWEDEVRGKPGALVVKHTHVIVSRFNFAK